MGSVLGWLPPSDRGSPGLAWDRDLAWDMGLAWDRDLDLVWDRGLAWGGPTWLGPLTQAGTAAPWDFPDNLGTWGRHGDLLPGSVLARPGCLWSLGKRGDLGAMNLPVGIPTSPGGPDKLGVLAMSI